MKIKKLFALFVILSIVLFPMEAKAVEEGQVWTFNFKDSKQTFSIPINGYYKIEAWGAEGASVTRSGVTARGGKGAYSTGTNYLERGETLIILVGEHKDHAGGGGSFVAKSNNTPLVVAGGGGSGTWFEYRNRYRYYDGGDGLGTIGTSPSGGSAYLNRGSGGGGFETSGGGYTGGKSFISTSLITRSSSTRHYDSSIGGGGGNYYNDDSDWDRLSEKGGGGGGYSGGNGSSYHNGNYASTGGTSYRVGTDLAGQSGVRSGHGMVRITLVEITDEGYVLERIEKKVDETKTETIKTKDKVIALEEKINELNNKVGNSKPEIINISWTNNKTLTYSSSEKLNLYVNDVNYTDSELTVKYSINGGSEVETSLIGNYINVNLSPGFNKVIVKVENPQGNKDVKEVYIWKL